MFPRALVLATALVSVSVASASAEVVTADVLDWNASTRTVTLEDFSQFSEIPASVKIPSELKAGISITVDYEATDNGMASYNSITVNNEISKRVIPNDKRSWSPSHFRGCRSTERARFRRLLRRFDQRFIADQVNDLRWWDRAKGMSVHAKADMPFFLLSAVKLIRLWRVFASDPTVALREWYNKVRKWLNSDDTNGNDLEGGASADILWQKIVSYLIYQLRLYLSAGNSRSRYRAEQKLGVQLSRPVWLATIRQY
jgi:hypothetical protein